MFTTAPDAKLVNAYREYCGSGTIYSELAISYDPDSKDFGRQSATRSARWAALGAASNSEIPRSSAFDSATQFIQPSDLDSVVVAGPEPGDYMAAAQQAVAAGVEGLSFVNCSPEMDKLFSFSADHLIPAIHSLKVAT